MAGIGWLWILVDPERQACHDKIAGTYVVRVPSGWFPVPELYLASAAPGLVRVGVPGAQRVSEQSACCRV